MYLHNLSPSETSDYTLWKTIEKLKQSQQTSPLIMKYEWARSDQDKADT
jgi:hypothetical protein